MRKPFSIGIFLFLFALPVHAQEVATVIAEGLGKDIESAVQMAAEAALTEVVGSFIDSDKRIERRKEIRDGIKTQTKSITSKISEYSQGSIQRLDVLDVEDDDGLIRVTAKVTVRIEDFKHYIKETVLAEKKIKKGLLGQLKVDEKQEQNIVQLFIDKVLKPLMDYQVIVPRIRGEIVKETNLAILTEIDRRFPGDGYVIRIPVEVTLNPDYLANAMRVLDETSEKKYRGNQLKQLQKLPKYEYSVWLGEMWGEKLHVLAKYLPNNSYFNISLAVMPDGVSGPPTVYFFPERTASELCQKTAYTVGRPNYQYYYFLPTIELSFVSSDGEVLREERLVIENPTFQDGPVISDHSFVIVESKEKNPRTYSLSDELQPDGHSYKKTKYGAFSTAVLYFHQSGPREIDCRIFVPTSREFYIVTKVPEDVLANADKIVLQYLK